MRANSVTVQQPAGLPEMARIYIDFPDCGIYDNEQC